MTEASAAERILEYTDALMTATEYAKSRGVSPSAISQSMKTKKNKERLEGHVTRKDGKLLLDEEAIRILDEARKERPRILVDSQESVQQFEAEKAELKREIDELKDQLKAAAKLSQTLADTNQKLTEEKNLLEDKRVEAEKTQLLLEDKTAKLEAAEEELAGSKERADSAEQKLRDIANAGFFARGRLIKALKEDGVNV